MNGYRSLRQFERHDELWLPAAELANVSAATFGSADTRVPSIVMNNSNPIAGTIVAPGGPRGIPQHWQTLAVDLYWSNTGTNTGNVGWRLRRGFIAAGTTFSSASVTNQSPVLVAAGGQHVLTVSQIETGIAVVAGWFLAVAIWRDFTSSVLTDSMNVLGLMLRKVT